MAVTKLSNSGIKTGVLKYDSMLAGNPAYSPAAFDSIATVTGNGSATTLTFSAIPDTYKHLQIRFFGRSLRAGVSDNLEINFNSDTGTNYSRHDIYGQGTSTWFASSTPNSTLIIGNNAIVASQSGSTNTLNYSGGIVDIHNYASTTQNKTVRVFAGWDIDSSGRMAFSTGAWLNSSTKITSITLGTGGNAFANGTTFGLYGIKG